MSILDTFTGNKKQVPSIAGMSASDFAADTIQLVSSSVGILPGIVGNIVVRLAIPAAERVLAGSGGLDDGGDSSVAGSFLAMAKDAAARGDEEQAVDYLSRAASLGNVDALIGLAQSVRADDPDKAIQLLERAAASGSDEALFNLAILLNGRDNERAKELLRPLVAKKYEWSAVLLAGILIEEGKEDEAEEILSANVFRLSAKGSANSAVRCYTYLGYLNREKNPDLSIEYYKLAARFGDPVAMHNLAAAIYTKKPEKARKLLLQAAAQGVGQSYTLLGNLAKDTDPLGAAEYFIKAIEGRQHPAVFALARLCGWTEGDSYRLASLMKALWAGKPMRPDYSEAEYAVYPLRMIGQNETSQAAQPAICERLRDYCGGW